VGVTVEPDDRVARQHRYTVPSAAARGESAVALNATSLTELGAQIAHDEQALAARSAAIERDRHQLIEKKRQQQLKHVERELREHATAELAKFESSAKAALDAQLVSLSAERAEKLSSVRILRAFGRFHDSPTDVSLLCL